MTTVKLKSGLAIGGTIFQQMATHKLIRLSPDVKSIYKIDHISINRKWRRSVGVKAVRGAGLGSDHCLALCKQRLKLKSPKKKKGAFIWLRQIKF